jgi:hypothetical protein
MRNSKQVLSGVAVALAIGTAAMAGYAGEPAGAEARARLAPFLAVLSNVDEHQTERRGSYEFTVHPGFSSRATLEVEGKPAQELHRQDAVYNLRGGQTAPPSRHAIRLTGGENGRDVGLVIDDPKRRVARIIVELYDESHKPGFRGTGKVVERVVVDNNTTTCPPDCEQGPPTGLSPR